MTVILANGDFPSHPESLRVLREAARVVCCDGAAQALLDFGRTPDYVVGDLDSIPPELRAMLAGRAVHIAEQDDNDLAKAFSFCLSKGWEDIAILGATGRREDHALGNFSHLFEFAARARSVEMVTDYGTFTPVRPEKTARRFLCEKGQAVSLFAETPSTLVTTRGLHWPLANAPLAHLWSGTLNRADADSFEVSCAGGIVLVYRPFPSANTDNPPNTGNKQ